jgi:hypothetical protein
MATGQLELERMIADPFLNASRLTRFFISFATRLWTVGVASAGFNVTLLSTATNSDETFITQRSSVSIDKAIVLI